jgi:hypothetical protein
VMTEKRLSSPEGDAWPPLVEINSPPDPRSAIPHQDHRHSDLASLLFSPSLRQCVVYTPLLCFVIPMSTRPTSSALVTISY